MLEKLLKYKANFITHDKFCFGDLLDKNKIIFYDYVDQLVCILNIKTKRIEHEFVFTYDKNEQSVYNSSIEMCEVENDIILIEHSYEENDWEGFITNHKKLFFYNLKKKHYIDTYITYDNKPDRSYNLGDDNRYRSYGYDSICYFVGPTKYHYYYMNENIYLQKSKNKEVVSTRNLNIDFKYSIQISNNIFRKNWLEIYYMDDLIYENGISLLGTHGTIKSNYHITWNGTIILQYDQKFYIFEYKPIKIIMKDNKLCNINFKFN